MRPTSRLVSAAGLAAAVTLVLTACGEESEAAAEDRACEQVQVLATEVDDFRTTVNGAPTVGELRDARDGVAQAREDLDEALDDVADDRAAAFEQAWDDLDAAVGAIEDDDSVPDALASLEEEVAAVVAARDELVAAIECSA